MIGAADPEAIDVPLVTIDDSGLGVTVTSRAGVCLLAAAVGAEPGVRGEAHTLRFGLPPGARAYGWGERALPPDRRGRRMTSWNTDAVHYGRGTDPLYGSYSLLLVEDDGEFHGLFWNDPHRTELDLSGAEQAVLTSAGGSFDLFVIEGPGAADVLRRYGAITGVPPLWPRWCLRLHQSRWGYRTGARAREVVDIYRRRELRLGVLDLDIDHMREHRILTFDRERFSDAEMLVAEVHADGARVVTIVDPGVKNDPDWGLHQRGTKDDVWVRDAAGNPYVGPVWPGDCVFPDFTAAHARRWWAAEIESFVSRYDLDGIWCDMNEPTVFTEEHPGLTPHQVAAVERTMPDDVQHSLDGAEGDHRTAHNLYGLLMAHATYEGVSRGNRRRFVLSRSGSAGLQRSSFLWTGDNSATWDHLRLAVEMVVGLGLSGVPFTGVDVGGFEGEPTPELFTRFLQVGALLPMLRIHSAQDTRDREPWTFGPVWEPRIFAALRLRSALLPYLYTLAEESSRTLAPLVRPAWWLDPDDNRLHEANGQVLLGDSLLAVPALGDGVRSVDAALPPGEWIEPRTGLSHRGATVLAAPPERLPMLVAAGAAIPWRSGFMVGVGSVQVAVRGRRYADDGRSFAYREGVAASLEIEGSAAGDRVELDLALHGDHRFARRLSFELIGLVGDVHATADGEELSVEPTSRGVGILVPQHARSVVVERIG